MGKVRKFFFRLPVKISMLAFCVYLGYNNADDIERLRLNLLEKRTHVKKGYYENVTNLAIFLDKEEGYFVPKYGTEDAKISISKDMYPNDMYGPLERRIKNGDYDAGKTVSLLNTLVYNYSDSLAKEEKSEIVRSLNLMKSYLEEDSGRVIEALLNYQ